MRRQGKVALWFFNMIRWAQPHLNLSRSQEQMLSGTLRGLYPPMRFWHIDISSTWHNSPCQRLQTSYGSCVGGLYPVEMGWWWFLERAASMESMQRLRGDPLLWRRSHEHCPCAFTWQGPPHVFFTKATTCIKKKKKKDRKMMRDLFFYIRVGPIVFSHYISFFSFPLFPRLLRQHTYKDIKIFAANKRT